MRAHYLLSLNKNLGRHGELEAEAWNLALPQAPISPFDGNPAIERLIAIKASLSISSRSCSGKGPEMRQIRELGYPSARKKSGQLKEGGFSINARFSDRLSGAGGLYGCREEQATGERRGSYRSH